MKFLVLVLCLIISTGTLLAQKPTKNPPLTITVKSVTLSRQFDGEGKIIEKTETEQQYSVQQGLRINTDLLKRVQNKSQKIDVCTSEQMCVLANATSSALGANQPVTFSMMSTTWSRCEDELVKTNTTQSGGTMTDYQVTSVFSVIQRPPVNSEPDPVPLVKLKSDMSEITPVPLVNPAYYIRLFVAIGGITPNINASAPRIQSQYYDCTTKSWQDNSNNKYGASIPDILALKSLNKNKKDGEFVESYVSPTFNEEELLAFLSNPVTGKTFNLKCRSYNKSPNGDEQMDVYVELKF